MRRSLAAAGAVLLLLSGCSGGEDEPVHLPSLHTKLLALTADPCHTKPREQPPYGCEKYVTQLANAARTVSAAGRAAKSELSDPGRRMLRGVNAFNKGGCDNRRPKSDASCYQALEAIAEAVEDVQAELEETSP